MSTLVRFYLALGRHDELDALAHLSGIPISILVGTHDRLTPQRFSQDLAERLPHARLVALEGAGHMLPLERAAEVLAELYMLAGVTTCPRCRTHGSSSSGPASPGSEWRSGFPRRETRTTSSSRRPTTSAGPGGTTATQGAPATSRRASTASRTPRTLRGAGSSRRRKRSGRTCATAPRGTAFMSASRLGRTWRS